MKKKNKLGKYEKGVIIIGVVAALILLILLTAEGIKSIEKNNNLAGLSEQGETIVDTPNAPTLSAGMIPVKYNGDNLIICQNDNSWYSYENGTPAYMMLNDGVYQSELAPDMTNKKLASENIGQVVTTEEQGTIYMWIPRFAINTETKEIKYIEPEVQLGGEWEVSRVSFMYPQTRETVPDFSLSGIWIEEKPVANTNEVNIKLVNMTGENNTYGFIANVKPISMTIDYQQTIEEYIASVVGTGLVLPDQTNTNRTILKVINEKQYEPIKAKIAYNETTYTIKIQVTYTKNGIAKIEDKNGNAVEFTNENGIITATVEAKSGKNHFKVIDNKGNKSELEVTAVLPIYATLFTATNKVIEGKQVYAKYGDISNKLNEYSAQPWSKQRAQIKTVDIVDEIAPMETARWFENCHYLTNIYNINNLDTSNVTSMWMMYSGCESLKELDLSSLDTSNVTNMESMFANCRKLTKLDLSSLDTSNVTTMGSMFDQCYNLKELDLSNLDTSNVTTMQNMFAYCNVLEELDLSNLDTRSVTSMYGMFQRCGSLTELDLSNFNTSNVTNMTIMFAYCTNLKTIYVGENWKVPIDSDSMFHGCGTSTTTLKE